MEENEEIESWTLIDQQQDKMNGASDFHGEADNLLPLILYKNQNDTLFLDSNKVADDVTSFLIHGKHFLFTVHSNTPFDHLYLITLKSLLDNTFERPSSNSSSSVHNLRKRNVEKNSVLITCSGSQIQLYLPRGNFEGIHHRILLIEQVYELV